MRRARWVAATIRVAFAQRPKLAQEREPSAGLVPIGLAFFGALRCKGVPMKARQAFGTVLEDQVLAPVAVMSGDDEDEYEDELEDGDDLDEDDEDFDPELDDEDFFEEDEDEDA